jgi:hypothetical protein
MTAAIASTFALLIAAEEQQLGVIDREDAAYNVINRAVGTRALSDESKADFYATLVENSKFKGDMGELTIAIDEAWTNSARRHLHG